MPPALLDPEARCDAREFEFTERDFERVRQMIHRRAGIALAASKRELVYSRVARRLRALGLRRFSDYLERLEDDDSPEWEAFTNALTTNLTSFFREPHHFPVLAAHLGRAGTPLPQTLWCCAASTGEEPWSIAITAVEAFGRFDAPVRILASDLDTQVLEQAERGVYALERVERLGAERLRRFFLRGRGPQAGRVRVRDELRRLVVFRRINLLDADWALRGPLDAIFCRNVMIYFDRPTQRRVLERFAPLLRADGLLFVGHSEVLTHAADLYRPCGRTVYRLAAGTGAAR